MHGREEEMKRGTKATRSSERPGRPLPVLSSAETYNIHSQGRSMSNAETSYNLVLPQVSKRKVQAFLKLGPCIGHQDSLAHLEVAGQQGMPRVF